MFFQFFEGNLRLHTAKFLVVVAICVVSCKKTDDSAATTPTFPVTFPIVKDTVFAKDYVADIHAVQNVELRSRVSGFVETIHADEGSFVKAGQLLFTISSHQYKQALQKSTAILASASAEAKAAELDLNNIKNLFDKKLVSQSELNLSLAKLEAAQAHVEEAKAQVANDELQVSLAQIRAPFSGTLNRIPNKVGSLIQEGTLLTSISDNSEVFVYFNVSEKDYLDIASKGGIENKREVSLFLANGEYHRFKGVIETVEGEVDKSTGNIAFRARFKNPDKLIKHGSTGKIRLTNLIEQAILVPQKSTFEIQDNVFVYVVDESGTVRLRRFQPKLRLPHFYVIESGLSTKDKIIYEGIQQVKEGDKVQTTVIPMDNIIAAIATL